MRCVVTGATGHIGNVLVRYLTNFGYSVTALVLPNEIQNAYIFPPATKIAIGDVTNKTSLISAFRGADVVFHLAGIVDIGSFSKKKMYKVNVDGTKNVVDICKALKVKRLVYVSSVHAIPELPKPVEITEVYSFSESFVKGTYAKTKAEATSYVLKNNTDELQTVIVHPSGVIGPYDYSLSNTGQLLVDCATGKIGAYLNGGYNFVDVRDVALGIINAAMLGTSGKCYILSGNYISVKDLMKHIEKITGVPAPKVKIPRWLAYSTGFFAELYYKLLRQKPLFTSYSVYTLGTNSNFSSKFAEKELDYTIRPLYKTISDTLSWLKKVGKLK